MHPNSLANLKPIQPGEVRNPSGRPKGSRDKLGQEFVQKLYEKFLERGDEAIDIAMSENPTAFLNVIARLMPTQIENKTKSIEELALELDDEQFTDLIEGCSLLRAAQQIDESAESKGSTDESSKLH